MNGQDVFCHNCGKQLLNNASFCASCGAKVKTENDFKKCVQCGTVLSSEQKFCTKCGSQVADDNRMQATAYVNKNAVNYSQNYSQNRVQSANGGSKTGLIIAIVAMILVVILGGAFFVFKDTIFSGFGSVTNSSSVDRKEDKKSDKNDSKTDKTDKSDKTDKEKDSTAKTTTRGDKVGVSMPTGDLQRWYQDGNNIRYQLEADGYEVDLKFAQNDIQTQNEQIMEMINDGCAVLIIAAIEGSSLNGALEIAKENNVRIISYDRLIMYSDAVDYYVTFDNYLVGAKQGEYIVDKLDLDNASGPFNMEIFTGDPGDWNASIYYNGAMDILWPYIAQGKLVVRSGQIHFDEVTTANWSTENAQGRMYNIYCDYYHNSGETIDAVLCSNDSTALGVTNTLQANYFDSWPVVTGQDCDIVNVKNIISGWQTMSVFKNTHVLSAKACEMAEQIMRGENVSVNDTITYDNGSGVIPSYLCEAMNIDAGNWRFLIDAGYYTEDQLR